MSVDSRPVVMDLSGRTITVVIYATVKYMYCLRCLLCDLDDMWERWGEKKRELFAQLIFHFVLSKRVRRVEVSDEFTVKGKVRVVCRDP